MNFHGLSPWALGAILLNLNLAACRTTNGGSLVAGSGPQQQQELQRTPTPVSGFVKTQGTTFVLNDKPFFFEGTNFYRLGLRDVPYTDADLDFILGKLSTTGISVVRIWGFSCETPSTWAPEGLMPSGVSTPPILDAAGNFSEEALKALDKVIAKAGQNGIRVILPMVNFEPAYCGMEWWNRVYGTAGESKQGFYCNTNVKKAYKKYVATLLNRVNTVSNIAYKNDPAIMDIEVANEPHTADGYELGTVDASCKAVADGKPGTIVNKWLDEMTTYVRSLDANHLISTGEEGYRADGDPNINHGWVNSGLKGVDFTRNVALPNVSFATTHLYPDNWDVQSSEFYSWYAPSVIQDRADIAHAAGKPIIVEETGFSKIDPNDSSQFMQKISVAGYATDRAQWLNAVYDSANHAGYAGTMVWQSIPNRADGSDYDVDDYTFSFSDPAMDAVLTQIKYAESQNH